MAWQTDQKDPVRESLLASGREPDLDAIADLFPPTTGEPAFDERLIQANLERLQTTPEVRTGNAFLDRSVKVGLAHIDATFRGDHPKYGVGFYAQDYHDGFPPTIISSVDALSAWGLHARAAQLWRYWLANLVRQDGSIRYVGTSLAEMGQLLHTAALLGERAGLEGWWQDGHAALDRVAENLLARCRAATDEHGLLSGVPEDDEKDKVGLYFHNSAWVARGLARYAELREKAPGSPLTSPPAIRAVAARLAEGTVAAIRRHWPDDPADWWLPPQVEPVDRPESMTGTMHASYTNYRYWPELLSSGILPRDLAERVVEARLSAGGQFCGMTRFEAWLDDWPLADYLFALWAMGRHWDFRLSLYGHVAYHQAQGHLTAYEQVTFPPGRSKAAYCLPCQLVAARAARLLVRG